MKTNPTPNTPGGVAVVGMGYWGRNLVRNFHELGALHTVCDSNPQVAEELGHLCPGTRFTRHFREVLAEPEIRAVALATPAVRHYEMAKAALLEGKDVFVEKPLAVDLQQGRDLVELAAANHRILMVGHILRYHPAVLKLNELIQAGELGKILYLYSNRLNIGKIRHEENILWSFATHDISVMLALLDEVPCRVSSHGGAYLNQHVYDVTVSQFDFPSGVQAHIFVSWLHPVKEQRLVVVGSSKMAAFDDTAEHKLVLYPHRVEWHHRVPTAIKAPFEVVPVDPAEPLSAECRHFLECLRTHAEPRTSGQEGLRVLAILDACQRSLLDHGAAVTVTADPAAPAEFFAHDTARVDPGCEVGAGTRVWHYSHVMRGARIGRHCSIGQNVNIAGEAIVGDRVKIQNNVSVYAGVTIEDDVFLGPSCVLTNVTNPRAQVDRHAFYEPTLIRRGSTIGANATILCGVTIGRYAFVAAGAVVTHDVPDYALVVGNPARQHGWMSRHGHHLPPAHGRRIMRCPETGFRYQEVRPGVLRCLDLAEDAPLPETWSRGRRSYRQPAQASPR